MRIYLPFICDSSREGGGLFLFSPVGPLPSAVSSVTRTPSLEYPIAAASNWGGAPSTWELAYFGPSAPGKNSRRDTANLFGRRVVVSGPIAVSWYRGSMIEWF